MPAYEEPPVYRGVPFVSFVGEFFLDEFTLCDRGDGFSVLPRGHTVVFSENLTEIRMAVKPALFADLADR